MVRCDLPFLRQVSVTHRTRVIDGHKWRRQQKLQTPLVARSESENQRESLKGESSYWKWVKTGRAFAIGGAAAVISAPILLGAAGFTPAGIAAGSVAASMMAAAQGSAAGVAIVGALQSAGAAGLGIAANTVVAVVGGSAATAARASWEKLRGKANDRVN